MILKSDVVAELLAAAKKEVLRDPQWKVPGIQYELEDPDRPDPLVIAPPPRFEPKLPLEDSGSSSVDLRLGTWFVTLRAAQMPCLTVDSKEKSQATDLARAIWKQLQSEVGLRSELQERIVNTVANVVEAKSRSASSAQLTETHYVPFGGTYILHPRSFVLGITLEWLRLPRKLAGSVIGKSSWGRRGLVIATATGVHPGFTGCLTLELTNVGEIPIEISPGMLICQLSLHRVEGDYRIDQSTFAGKRKPVLGPPITRDRLAERLANPM